MEINKYTLRCLFAIGFIFFSSSLFSQALELGFNFSFSDTRLFYGSDKKYTTDFLNNKIKNRSLEYDYTIFDKEPQPINFNEYKSPFLLQISLTRFKTDSYVKNTLNWYYKFYLRYFNNKYSGIYFQKENTVFINDTVVRITANINENSNDLVFGSNLHLILFKKKFFELHTGIDFGIGATLNNKITEYVYQNKYLYNEEFRDTSREVIIKNYYTAMPCLLTNLGALIGIKISIYKKWGFNMNYTYSLLSEYQFSNAHILKKYSILSWGIFYKLNYNPVDLGL